MDMRLEDLQTEEMHPVAGGAVTLGRDSRRSTIVIADPGVSGAHARVFERAGRFFIEDNNSSNGTFVEGTRLRGELELKNGFVIALHKYKFRVVIDGGSVGDSTAMFESKGSKGEGTKPDNKVMTGAATRTQARSQTARSAEPEDAVIEDEENDEREEHEEEHAEEEHPPALRRNERRDAQQRDAQRRSEIIRDPGIDDGYDLPIFENANTDDENENADDVESDDERPVENKAAKADIDPDQMKAGFGKALAYYMGAVPKMAFVPRGAVATMIGEQPLAPMEKMALALWAAPPLALGAIVSLIATIVVGLVTGTFGIGSIVSPLIAGVITIVVGSAIAGWVWHPFLNWWVKLLRGESDPQSRTNMMVTTFTTLSLIYIAYGVGALFTLLVRIPVVGPFVQIGPLLLASAASLVSLYASLAWYKYFRVTHWVPKIIMVFGVLVIANAAWGTFGLIRASIASARTTGSPNIADSGSGLTLEQKQQLAAAQNAAQAAGADVEAASAQAQAALAAAKDQVAPAAQQLANNAQAQAAQVQAQAAQALDTNAAAVEPVVPTPPQTRAERIEAARTEAAAKAAAAKADAAAASPKPASSGKPTYAEFSQHAAAVDKMIDDDPSLLVRVPGALALYKKIHANDAKLKTKGKLDPVSERIHQAEMYSANVDAVEELFRAIQSH